MVLNYCCKCFNYLVRVLKLIGRDRHHGPVIAVIECPNSDLLKSNIQALDDFPCVNIPSNARDSQYQVTQ